MSREVTTFYEHIAPLCFEDGTVPKDQQEALKTLMVTLVDVLQETIGSIDFWVNADKQKRLRGTIKTEITKAGIEAIKTNRERVTVEVIKLARNRHDVLIAAANKAKRG